MAGYVAALHLARAAAGSTEPPLDLEAICTAIAAAPGIADAALSGFDVRALAAGMGFVTAGTYGGLVDNLRYKVVEGMLLPAPPVWDVLHAAHGPLQQVHAARRRCSRSPATERRGGRICSPASSARSIPTATGSCGSTRPSADPSRSSSTRRS